MALIGKAVSEEKIFENGGRTTDGRRTDGRRLDGYTISSPCEPPNGSGELKWEMQRLRLATNTKIVCFCYLLMTIGLDN